MKKIILLIGFITLVVLISGCAQKKQVQEQDTGLTGISAFDNLPKNRELTQQEIDSDNFRELEIKISGMSCPYCANGVATALLSQEGIIKTDLTLEKRGGTIIYDTTKLTKNDIINSEIFDGVYKATLVDDQSVNRG